MGINCFLKFVVLLGEKISDKIEEFDKMIAKQTALENLLYKENVEKLEGKHEAMRIKINDSEAKMDNFDSEANSSGCIIMFDLYGQNTGQIDLVMFKGLTHIEIGFH